MIPKFRAWIKSLELMADVLTINFEEETLLLKGHERNTWAEFEQVILMQYTGLRDKNGVEIYEGDIVKHTDNFSNITTINKVYWKGGSLVFDVVVDEGLVYDVPLYKITEDNTEGYDDELEVLGNIYENPELLEEST